jgi:hypothetical protein
LVASPDSSSSSISATYDADDFVIVYHKNRPDEDEILRVASVERYGIRLIDLAIAAKVVHQKRAFYKMLQSQCYWYADMLFTVLERQFGIEVKVNKLQPCTNAEKGQARSKASGKCGSFLIYRPSEETISEAAAIYAGALVQFEKEVCFLLFIPKTLT